MIRSILCFGDSNTYGVNPEDNSRFPLSTRWTGRLQSLLGHEGYQVIEEGYCGRTTCFSDDSDEMRSGIKVLNMVLKTHCPTDMVVIMLGTNDFKAQFSMKAKVSAFGVKKIIEKAKKFCLSEGVKEPVFLIVSPIEMGDGIDDSRFWEYSTESKREIEKLPAILKSVAAESGALFFDAATVAGPGSDQLHMTAESHECLASALYEIIKEYFESREVRN